MYGNQLVWPISALPHRREKKPGLSLDLMRAIENMQDAIQRSKAETETIKIAPDGRLDEAQQARPDYVQPENHTDLLEPTSSLPFVTHTSILHEPETTLLRLRIS